MGTMQEEISSGWRRRVLAGRSVEVGRCGDPRRRPGPHPDERCRGWEPQSMLLTGGQWGEGREAGVRGGQGERKGAEMPARL